MSADARAGLVRVTAIAFDRTGSDTFAAGVGVDRWIAIARIESVQTVADYDGVAVAAHSLIVMQGGERIRSSDLPAAVLTRAEAGIVEATTTQLQPLVDGLEARSPPAP